MLALSEHANTYKAPMLRPNLISMRLIGEGVLVEGSHGFILLKKEADAITATPVGKRPKRTPGYVERVRKEVLERAKLYSCAWAPRHDGSLQITDHSAFYEATFNPTLRCLELIQQWLKDAGKRPELLNSHKTM